MHLPIKSVCQVRVASAMACGATFKDMPGTVPSCGSHDGTAEMTPMGSDLHHENPTMQAHGEGGLAPRLH
jgi:hypothetical protein